MTKLYIDDIRDPKGEGFEVVRTSNEAIEFMQENGIPEYISFDHDLGGEDTAMVVVKWMVTQDMDNKYVIPENFKFNVHSANVCGKENIEGYLNSYLKHRESNR